MYKYITDCNKHSITIILRILKETLSKTLIIKNKLKKRYRFIIYKLIRVIKNRLVYHCINNKNSIYAYLITFINLDLQ